LRFSLGFPLGGALVGGEFAAAIDGGAEAAGADEVVVGFEELAVGTRGAADGAGELIARWGEAVGRGEGVELGF